MKILKHTAAFGSYYDLNSSTPDNARYNSAIVKRKFRYGKLSQVARARPGQRNTTRGCFAVRAAPRSDPKKLEKPEKVETKSQGRLNFSQGLICLKVAL